MPHAYDRYEDLLNNDEVEAVYVASPGEHMTMIQKLTDTAYLSSEQGKEMEVSWL